MDKFKELVALCRHSVEITVNDHRDAYESVREWLGDAKEDIDSDVYDEMVMTNTVVKVQAYPRTAISFYLAYHYDIDKAVEQVLEAVKKDHK